MILLGCLLAFSIAIAPRLVLILAWIFSDRWQVVWQGEWIWPLLGIIFLPYTTVMYMLAWTPAVAGGSNIEGWDWMWIILGLILDLMKWAQILQNRKEAQAQASKYYPSGAPKDTGAAAAATAAAAPAPAPAATPEPEPAAPEQAPAEPEPAPAEPEPAPAAAEPEPPAGDAGGAEDDAADQLAKLEQLHSSGALTDEEFEAAKAKLQD